MYEGVHQKRDEEVGENVFELFNPTVVAEPLCDKEVDEIA